MTKYMYIQLVHFSVYYNQKSAKAHQTNHVNSARSPHVLNRKIHVNSANASFAWWEQTRNCHPSRHGKDCPTVVVIVGDRTVRTVLLL